jgi:hypothetical protein
MVAHRKDGPPPRDRVGAHHGVDGIERVACVLGRAARARVEVEAVAPSGFAEEGLGVSGGQGVEKAAEGRGYAVIELVTGGPECVCCVGGGVLVVGLVQGSRQGLESVRGWRGVWIRKRTSASLG